MTTLSTCWKITRADATVEGYTDHDTDLVVSGVTYYASAGFAPSAVDRSIDLSVDNQQVMGIIDNDNITADLLLAGAYDGARVELIEVNWSTSTKVRTLLVGFLGDIQVSGNGYAATLYSIENELQKPIGRTVTLRCDAALGDSRCGYSLSADSVLLTSVTDSVTFFDSALGGSDGDYNNGKITWLTGDNAGITCDVKRYTATGGKIEVYVPLPNVPEIGDTANIYVGCDRTLETCRDTFSNVDNFRGFPYLPGINDLVAGTQE